MAFTEGVLIYHTLLQVDNINFVTSHVALDFKLFWQCEFALPNTVDKCNSQFRALWGWVKRCPTRRSSALPPLLLLWVVYSRGGRTFYMRSHFYFSAEGPVLWDLDWDSFPTGEDSEWRRAFSFLLPPGWQSWSFMLVDTFIDRELWFSIRTP